MKTLEETWEENEEEGIGWRMYGKDYICALNDCPAGKTLAKKLAEYIPGQILLLTKSEMKVLKYMVVIPIPRKE